MRRELDRREYEVFQTALEMPTAQRGELLDRECGDDGELRRAVEELLAADALAGSFLQTASGEPPGGSHFSWSTAASSGNVPAQPNLAGQAISHYCVGERLGAGGMGEVYLADDLALSRPAALKVLRGDMPQELQSQLLQEGKVNARLQHPAIATFYESGVADEVAYIAMEYVQGTTLRARLADGPLAGQEIYSFAIALLEAVAHAHAASIVHGDIKPANIMLTADGLPKLLDFGLARAISGGADATWKAYRMAGTAGYMAPELVNGAPAGIGSDLFAVAAVLYEAVSGRCAFGGKTPLERLSAVMHTSPEPLVDSHEAVKVWPVLARAMARSPDQRYASANEFLKAVRACSGSGSYRRVTSDVAAQQTKHLTEAAARKIALKAEIDARYQSGRELLMRSEKGSLDQATTLFQQVLGMEAGHAPALAGLAAVHALRFTFGTNPESLAAAVAFARRAIDMDPELSDAYVWLGYALYNQGDVLGAYARELEAIELEPDNFLAHYFAIGPLCHSSTRAEANRLLRDFDPLAPCDDAHLWRWKRAMVHVREATRMKPEHGFSWLAQGWCHTELEDFAAARECLERTIALEVTSPIPTSGAGGYLGECLRRSGELAEARAACLAGLEATEGTDHMYRDTWRALCLCSLGRTALDQADMAAAKAAFTQAVLHIRGRPRARSAGHLLVQALAGLSRTSADASVWGEAVDLDGRREGYDFRWLWGCSEDVTQVDLGRAALHLGQHDAAHTHFLRAADYGSRAAARETDLLAGR